MDFSVDIIALFWDIDYFLFLEVASDKKHPSKNTRSYKDREHSSLLLQGYLVLNKLSGYLNFWIFLFSPGAVRKPNHLCQFSDFFMAF